MVQKRSSIENVTIESEGVAASSQEESRRNLDATCERALLDKYSLPSIEKQFTDLKALMASKCIVL